MKTNILYCTNRLAVKLSELHISNKKYSRIRYILPLLTSIVFFFIGSARANAQNVSYQLSSHILDINTGQPAKDVTIKLYKQTEDGKWVYIAQSITDNNGRVKNFLPEGDQNNHGVYKLCFLVEPYFTKQNVKSFYPFIDVVFEIKDNNHYHVPIVLSPYGYSTYRGN